MCVGPDLLMRTVPCIQLLLMPGTSQTIRNSCGDFKYQGNQAGASSENDAHLHEMKCLDAACAGAG